MAGCSATRVANNLLESRTSKPKATVVSLLQARPLNRKRYRVQKAQYLDDNDDDESVRLRDQMETEELERHIRERDEARTRRPTKLSRKEEKEAIRRANEDVAYLRKVSRQEYLKKREDKKIAELRGEIIDEELLFDGMKLTLGEIIDAKHKKQVYDLVKRQNLDDGDDLIGYRMLDSYDLEGNVNQERRFAVILDRYRDDVSKQSTWEENQIRRAKPEFGSKHNKKGGYGGYDLVFDDHNELIKTCVMEGDKVEEAKAEPESRKLREVRETLPIFEYRERFLQAVRDHQILIVVGETGSGKTTQIPQFLHEAGYTQRGMIGCTQPRRVAAMSVAGRVSKEMGVKLGREVGYSIRFEDCTSEKTVINYMTDGILLREFHSEPMLDRYGVIMIDEAHERTVSTDILFGLVKDLARMRPDLKLLISSATLDAIKFSEYFDFAPIFNIPGRPFPVEIFYTKAPEADYLDAAIRTVLQIHLIDPSGDILVFLTGQEEIEIVEDILKQKIRGFGTKIPELVICPIYANLPTDLQAKIFEPTPHGARKVVLATNIAETSLTIDGIRYVIDSGYSKVNSYDPHVGMESLIAAPISKAAANQRAGRAGRTGPGVCYRLYTNFRFKEELEQNTAPEIQRTNLGNVVLSLKMFGIDDLMHFDFMDPPSSEALLEAVELLYSLGALNRLGGLTKVGRRMAESPLDPMLSKMIVASDTYKCSKEIITIAAMLSVGNSIFYIPKDKRVQADAARRRFCYGCDSDHIALLNVYNEWKEYGYGRQWCYENFVQFRSMKRARDIRDQLEGLLERVEIELKYSLNDMEAIKKCITAGFFPHSAKLQQSGSYQTIKRPQTVYIHPASGLAQVHPSPRWVVYNELVLTTKEYLRQVTEIKPEWLVEIAPHYYHLKDVKDILSPHYYHLKDVKDILSTEKMPRGTRRVD